MKILFFASHPGHIRNFESTLRGLGERGHGVHLAFDRYKIGLEAQEDLIHDLAETYPSITFGNTPKRPKTREATAAKQLRTGIDYLRYLAPEFSHADRLRERVEARAPRAVVELARQEAFRSPERRRALDSAARALERSIATPEVVVDYIVDQDPDAVLVTPLLELGVPQLDYLRAARKLRIPTGLLVASWDNLTTKGVIQEIPDLVTVWNEAQVTEAIDLHAVPPGRVVATGANAYDHWFDWSPSTTREEFCRSRGLDPDQPYILYVGSSSFIAPDEAPFINRWIAQIREGSEQLAQAGVLVRPHPTNPLDGKTAEQRALAELDRVAVWPPSGANPTDIEKRSAYYDSIYHSSAVVGVNTSALIESAIVGRQVLTVLDPEYREMQEGSVHFHHLVRIGGGMLQVARTFDEHERQLERALDTPDEAREHSERFLGEFIRPYGLDEAATPRLVEAIEALDGIEPDPPVEPARPTASQRAAMALLRTGALTETGGPVKRREKRLRHALRRDTGVPLSTRARFAARRVARKALETRLLRAGAYHVAPRIAAETTRANGHPPLQMGLRELLLAEIERAARDEEKRRHGRTRPKAGDDRGLRILFSMAYPGYLRYYDSVVRELAERGHHVQLCFNVEHKQAEGAAALAQLGEVSDRISMTRLPKIDSERWKPITRATRVGMDYVRYLDPAFANSGYLRDRVGDRLPEGVRFLRNLGPLKRDRAGRLARMARALEASIPTTPDLDEFIALHRPDVVVVTPLITVGSIQNDLVKSARKARIPVVLGVASWDHLTTKGLLRVPVDAMTVWNEQQAKEAERFHAASADQIVITGAQPFDRWFEQRPRPRQVICRKAGLPPRRPYLLFLGSTQSISEPEAERAFVLRWIAALRDSDDPKLRSVGVMIRPHPYNAELWTNTEPEELGDQVGIWPRIGANPVLDEDRADYYDSLRHAAAVVGINTSAMIEAAIVGTPVFTIKTSEFEDTQSGTIHFSYLLQENGGPASTADSLEEHVDQLRESAVLSSNGGSVEALSRFVDTFVRPNGPEQPGTPLVADAIEHAARTGSRHARAPMSSIPLHWSLALLGNVLLTLDRDRLISSAEANRFVTGHADTLAAMAGRTASWMQPGVSPFGEVIRIRRPEVVSWLEETGDQKTLRRKWKAYRKASEGRLRASVHSEELVSPDDPVRQQAGANQQNGGSPAATEKATA
jgi:hypothetical protein